MPYIGMFTEDALQKQIQAAGEKLAAEGLSEGIVFHADTSGDVHLSAIKKLGDSWSVEGTVALDASSGFKFDREHVAGKIDIIKKW